MTAEEEKKLISRVLAGERDAFEPLVTANQTRVYSMALRITGNEADAADAAQEAFVRAYTALGSFRGESRFSTWLCRLAGNAAIDILRARKADRSISLSELANEDGELPDFPDESCLPETELEKKELREEVRRAMAELPEEYRAILSMRELGELSYEELGEALSLEQGTVKSRLSRARARLCAILLRSGNFSACASSKERKGGARS